MTINYPTSLDSFINPSATDNLSTPAVLHSTQHSNLNDAVGALQAKVGVNSSAVTTSHEYKINQIRPLSYRKNLVVLGSSTAAGTGASPVSNGWTQKLATSLASVGFTTTNVAVAGTNTGDGISRFYTDVAPLNPDIVLLAYGYGNELAGNTDSGAYTQLITNIKKLIIMTRQQGAIPIVVGPWPRDTSTTAQRAYTKMYAADLDEMGVKWICHDSLDDGTGGYISGYSVDGVHTTNDGHAEMHANTTRSMFYDLLEMKRPDFRSTSARLAMGTTTPTTNPILWTPTSTVSSFTAFFRMQMTSTTTDIAFLGVGTNTTNKIWNNSGAGTPGALAYLPSSGSEIASTVVPTTDLLEHSVALSHNALTGVSTFYIDGVSIGTVTETLTCSAIALGSKYGFATFAKNVKFRDFVVWRTCLLPSHIAEAHAGTYRKGSMEFFSPLDVTDVTQPRIINHAPTDSYATLDTTTNLFTSVI